MIIFCSMTSSSETLVLLCRYYRDTYCCEQYFQISLVNLRSHILPGTQRVCALFVIFVLLRIVNLSCLLLYASMIVFHVNMYVDVLQQDYSFHIQGDILVKSNVILSMNIYVQDYSFHIQGDILVKSNVILSMNIYVCKRLARYIVPSKNICSQSHPERYFVLGVSKHILCLIFVCCRRF